jgi:Tfp pilus assembly protein PilN
MALRINLYHEVLRAKRQQQYDPLKLSVLGLAVVAVGMAVFYGVQLKRTSDARAAYNTRSAEFKRLDPLSKEAAKKEVELNKQLDLSEKLTRRMEKRTYWAPVFESVLAAVPANVQLTKLACDTGRDKSGTCQMNIEGIAADQEPRAVAEDLRKAIGERVAVKYPNATAAFKNLDESSESVTVKGKRVAAVVFTINLTFKPEVTPPVAAPPPKPKRIAQQ